MFKYLSIILILFVIVLSGCATVPQREAMPRYNLNGTSYYPLIALCDLKNIEWRYDTFARTVILSKDSHKVNLKVGDTLVMIDGRPEYIKEPIDLYQGTIVVPEKFKEHVLDVLFKESTLPRRTTAGLLKIKKVVIDPGHGGNDPGTIGTTGVREKDINLDIAKRLANLLRGEGVEVVMTRSSDRFISLQRRVDIANDSRADLFVSVHSNANRVRSLNGFEVYYVASNVNDSARAMLAAKNAGLNIDGSQLASNSLDLKATLWDMIYTLDRAESIELSRSICKLTGINLDCRIIGVKGARFYVLKGARMPAVLIEAGFLSNPAEERKLKNGFYRQKIAESILQGLRDYAQDSQAVEVVHR